MNSNTHAVLQLEIHPHERKEKGESYADGFRGIRTGITMAFLFFWIPFVVIYAAAGWWYVVGYGAMLTVAAAVVGTVLKICRGPKSLSNERELKVLSS